MIRAPVRVEAVALEARAATLFRRSFKVEAKRVAIDLAIACLDLTTLEGKDTAGKVRGLCARAAAPAPGAPHAAAVCVYPTLVPDAAAALAGTGVKVASVAAAFPSGLSSLDVKLQETREAVAAGAQEIDMVIERGALLAGYDRRVREEIEAVRVACEGATLKVILEAGELGSYQMVRRACDIALAAGADFLKTSTGKIGISSTPPIALLMCEAIREHAQRSGRAVGLKLAGGVRTSKAALGYLALVKETLGDAWLAPARFRIGASSLLDDLVLQRAKEASGSYGGAVYVASA
jgi:deoxyribose-phosphate aldolase